MSDYIHPRRSQLQTMVAIAERDGQAAADAWYQRQHWHAMGDVLEARAVVAHVTGRASQAGIYAVATFAVWLVPTAVAYFYWPEPWYEFLACIGACHATIQFLIDKNVRG